MVTTYSHTFAAGKACNTNKFLQHSFGNIKTACSQQTALSVLKPSSSYNVQRIQGIQLSIPTIVLDWTMVEAGKKRDAREICRRVHDTTILLTSRRLFKKLQLIKNLSIFQPY